MSRSGYSDDLDYQTLNLYRASVDRAIRGKRGQKMLMELRDALDSMPVKRLIPNQLVTTDGECCTMGRLAQVKQLDVSQVDADDPEEVGKLFDIARCLAAEIAYENDERGDRYIWGEGTKQETPEERWVRMRKWVEDHIAEPVAS